MRHCIHLVALIVLACALSGCPTPEPRPPDLDQQQRLAAMRESVEAVQAQQRAQLEEPGPQCVQVINDRADDLIVAFEVRSREYYEKHLVAPYWPVSDYSGVTVGIGDDLGPKSASQIESDWRKHPRKNELAALAGIRGPSAGARIKSLKHIRIEWDLAREVFSCTTVVRYYRMMLRAFPGADQLDADAQGALTSLVFNRGSSMTGHARRHMRAIRDECVPERDNACIQRQLRDMVAVWKNSSIERGMTRRRFAEADLLGGSP